MLEKSAHSFIEEEDRARYLKEAYERGEDLNELILSPKDVILVEKIIAADSKDELQAQFDLFNMNQAKKNALRILKLRSLLDKVEDQAIERFEKRPDQVSNRELLDYMQIVSSQIEKSQNVVDSLQDKPMISAVQNNTEVNINVSPTLNRESKEKVIDVIQALLKQTSSNSSNPELVEEVEIVEAEEIEEVIEEVKPSIPNVFSSDLDEEDIDPDSLFKI